ncbi:3-oxoacyl-ACP reductase [Actinoplanes friuliensis DSM 7358]|uniref:3-oxoacyl-ACP reductase n=1 Tax=Actinoplanes friuliensis DSM 7358 TaxID=1246995 RepID=U5W759_9ACTN|nr:3-oxoacyl-ACP reductase [Actinoplanes friuliensis DSM 7358]
MGKTAVVTGGSRGIGRAIVERLTRDGATVIFGYRSRDDEAKAVEEAAPGARGFRADLATPGAIIELLQRAGELDILVTNAAASFTPTALADITEDEYDRVFAVNTKSTFQALQYAARHLRDNGRIISISTLNTTMPPPGCSLYVGSKGAVEQFSAVAARELGARGITVNVVSPGATDTDLLRSTNTEEALAAAAQMTPLGRLGRPADVADVVAFLAGPDGRWMTGQNLHAGGGLA